MSGISSTAYLTDDRHPIDAEYEPFDQGSSAYPMARYRPEAYRAFSDRVYPYQAFYHAPARFATRPVEYLHAVPRRYQQKTRFVLPSSEEFEEPPSLATASAASSLEQAQEADVYQHVTDEDARLEHTTTERAKWQCGTLSLSFLLLSLVLLLVLLLLGVSNMIVRGEGEYQDGGNVFLLFKKLPLFSNTRSNANTTAATSETKKIPTCVSDGCDAERRSPGGNLNYSVDPCSNFYSHVCPANWYGDNGTLDTYVSRATGTVLRHLWDYLSDDYVNISSASFVGHAAFLARGCMKKRKDVSEWIAFRDILSDLGIPGWPYHNNLPNVSPQDVARVTDKLLGTSTLVTVLLRQGSWENEMGIYVDSPPIFLRRFVTLEATEGFMTYSEFVYKVLSLGKRAPRETRDLASEIVKLEEMMAEAAAPSSRSVPIIHATRPVGAFKNLRNWNWLRYLTYFTEGTPGVSLANIAILDRNYIDQLAIILPDVRRRTLINYIGYLLLIRISPLLPDDEVNFIAPVSHAIKLTTGGSARLAACMFMLERIHPLGVRMLTWSAMMRKSQSFDRDEDKLVDIFRGLQDAARSEMKRAAHSAPWLTTNESRIVALQIDRMKIEVLPVREEETLSTSTFPAVPEEQGPMIAAYYKLARFLRTKYWAGADPTQFQEPMTPSESVFRPGFSYDPQRSAILLSPATVAFAAKANRLSDAASIPLVLAPLVRGMFATIDARGSTVGADGATHKLLSTHSRGVFLSRSWCIQGAFLESSKTLINNGPDESSFLYENVADVAIVEPLYNIFLKLARNEDVPNVTPGVSKQRAFFVNYAWMFCEPVHTESYVKQQLRYKTSVPGRFRVNLPLKRFGSFAKVFDCAPGSRMNPRRSCTFW
ncbi:neprilysin-2-like [Ornithodoros turicata]|uniref:neprilysin-2-like n=1 Tax=Ornithodoros turicata TaxID=34597 RepID=UPI00313A09A9